MDFKQLNNKIIIIDDSIKNNIIKKISSLPTLINVKIITLSELKKKYYYDYNNRTIYYIKKKYNVSTELAKIYLENLYYVDKILDKKTEFLYELKIELEKNKLLYKNELFIDYLKNKNIVLFNVDLSNKFYKKIIDEISKKNNIDFVLPANQHIIKKELYVANSLSEEIEFIATRICELLKKGININKIKLANVQENYYFQIKQIFKLFNIPVELPNVEHSKGTLLVSLFKKNLFKGIPKALEILNKNIKSIRDEELYNKIINVINTYMWCDNFDQIEVELVEEIEKILLENKHFDNSIKIIDFVNDVIEDDEFVFLINYTQNVIPAISKDEDYLSDKIKSQLDINTSYENNNYNNQKIQNIIKKTRNLIVTYSNHDLVNELYISSSYDEKLFIKKEIYFSYNNSDNYNKIKLISFKDENRKFGTSSIDYLILNNHYNDFQYLDYNNNFKGINSINFNKYIKNISLSYTNINSYYECAFKYYLSYILKIEDHIQNFQSLIGSIYHEILSKCFSDNFNFETCWENAIRESKYVFNNSEKYFQEKLKNALKDVIKIIKMQMSNTLLKKELYEKKIVVNLDAKSVFIGFIDKIIYDEIDNKKIVVILDYKTGQIELNLSNINYGLNLQLPVYIYLIKNSKELKDSIIGGFYLQKIISNSQIFEDKIEDFKWKGYSNSNESILNMVDMNYKNSNLIKNMKVSNNGFYQYAKVISDDNMQILYNLVSKKIIEAKENIWNMKFSINPKQLKEENISCKFCKFKDICYLENKDIVKFKDVTFDEILENGGK